MKGPTKSQRGPRPAKAPAAVIKPAATKAPSPPEAVPVDAECLLAEPDPMPDLERVWKAGFAPLIDAGLGGETAMVKAGEIGGALLQQFLSIANDAPKTLRYVLADAASGK